MPKLFSHCLRLWHTFHKIKYGIHRLSIITPPEHIFTIILHIKYNYNTNLSFSMPRRNFKYSTFDAEQNISIINYFYEGNKK